MGAKTKTPSKKSFLTRHWHVKHVLIGLLIIIVALMGWSGYSKWKVQHRQNSLQPFYSTNGLPAAGPLGEVVRHEPMDTVALDNGSVERVLYRTQRADGSR